MAEKMMFTVDASQIIAKMHFAALQATRGDASNNDAFFVNTGIQNDDPNGSPEKIGKTRFNLENSSGTYYVGYVVNVGYHQSFEFDNAMNDIIKLRSQLYPDDGVKLTDELKKDSPEKQQFDKNVKIIKKKFEDANKKVPADDEFTTAKGLTSIRDEIKKIIDSNATGQKDAQISTFKDELQSKKEEVAEYLQTYMEVFAGADNVTKISPDTVTTMQVSSTIKDSNDKNLVKNFQIQPIPEKEKNALLASFKAKALKEEKNDDPKVKNCIVKMCFYVEYKLTVDEK